MDRGASVGRNKIKSGNDDEDERDTAERRVMMRPCQMRHVRRGETHTIPESRLARLPHFVERP